MSMIINEHDSSFRAFSTIIEQKVRNELTKKRTDNTVETNYFIFKDDIFGSKDSKNSKKKDLLYNNCYLKQIYEDVCLAIRSYESSNKFSPKHFVAILSMALVPFIESNYLPNREYKFKFKIKNTITEAVYNFKDNSTKKKSETEVDNQYGAGKEYIEMLTSCWNNPKSYNEKNAIDYISAQPTFNIEDKLNKILHLINQSVNGRIINDYLDIPKYLLFASALVEYAEKLPKKKKNSFNVYEEFKNNDSEKQKAAYGQFKSDATKAINALRTVLNIINLTIFKLKIPNGTLTEQIAKMQAQLKIKKFLCTSIEILIWYKYFSPIITVGNITGSLELWGSLKQNAFVKTCKLVDENVELFNDLKKANDNYGWNIANAIKKYAANLNITDLSGHLDNHPIYPVNNSQSNLPQSKHFLQSTAFQQRSGTPPLQNIPSRQNTPFQASFQNSQNLPSQSLHFQSLPSPSLSNKSDHTQPYILENDDNVSEMSELVFSNPESEAEELRKQEELYALGSRHVENASKGLLQLKEITKECSQPIQDFLNKWAEDLDLNIFTKSLITSTLNNYDGQMFNDGLYRALGLNDEISYIDVKFQNFKQMTLYEQSIELPNLIISLQNNSKTGLQKFYKFYKQAIVEIDESKIKIEKEKDQFKMFLQIPNIKNTIDLKAKNFTITYYENLMTNWNEFIQANYQVKFEGYVEQVQNYFNTNSLEDLKANTEVNSFQLAHNINNIFYNVNKIVDTIRSELKSELNQ
ncbi:12220_t:CDS:2 [Cetraspora pellucida]|uniref:12220_t:CDS:1 n=1 Tax=Cetraspora pellucida TaxID=1433469 RepID=A0ACA9N897_9GLOM|nr:12220_t:CDS:2 [Cetraspora pellucida]